MKRYGNRGGRWQTALLALLCLSFCMRLVAQTAQTPLPPTPVAASATAAAVPEDKPIVLDHVVAIINNDVLLESDVREEMRFAALQPITVPTGQNTHVRAAQRLINRTLMLRQMEQQQQINYKISDGELQQNLDELRKEIPACREMHCTTEEGWQAFLKLNGLTEPEVNNRWRERLEILKFIQMRFGSGIRIPRQDIENYYNTNVVKTFEKMDQKPPTLESVTPRIREILLQLQVNSLLRDWLKSLRDQGSVQVLDPEYGPTITNSADDDSGGGS
jgi:hypothetical protein